MNKYLFKKIEESHSAYFENLIFMANEVCRERISEAFEEFTELDPIEITKVLEWNDKETTLELIKESVEEKEFAGLMLEYDMTGFLAECRMPECSNFLFEEGKKRPYSWSVHNGICSVFWIYAESIGELVEKLGQKAEELFLEAVEKSKESTSQADA